MVKTGLEMLLTEHIGALGDANVGIVANHASVTSDLTHITDALHAKGVKIKALFGPEHGARGDVADGEAVGDATDARLGVPVFSLYGKSHKPSEESLKGLDTVIVDLQDVGSRFYTFLYTMASVMEACKEHGVAVWILDRPNPISGLNADGPILEEKYSSFVGLYAIAQRHGLTVGELARLFHAKFGIGAEPHVVQMTGWTRDMWFDETGLPWVMPSPNMPTLDTAALYPGLCLIEGTNASEGRGTVRPFETFGAPWVDPVDLKKTMQDFDLPGVMFRESYFQPNASKFDGVRCGGVQVYVTNRCKYRPVVTGVAAISALLKLYPKDFEFRAPAAHGRRFFDLLSGTNKVREAIVAGKSPTDIAESWEPGLVEYGESTKDALLY